MLKSVTPMTGTAAHAGQLLSCSPDNPFPDTSRSSAPSNLFGEWTDSYMSLRDVAEEDGDESMLSSPLMSSTIDGSLSPLPPALVPTLDLGDPLGISEMDLTAGPLWTAPGGNIAFCASLPVSMVPSPLPSDVFSPPTESRMGRSNTVPSRKKPSTALGELTMRTPFKRPRDERSPKRRAPSCDCVRPDRPSPGQKEKGLLLTDLPTEILVEIIQYAIVWPPSKPPQCKHGLLPHRHYSRRATTGEVNVRPRLVPPAGPSSASTIATPDTSEDPRDKFFGVYTLLRIEGTCKRFREILRKEDQLTDKAFWKAAARSCWKLPEELSDVQGHEEASQTSWRNLVEVFVSSERGQFGTGEKGKRGVNCFGAKRVCPPASTWEMEKFRRKAIERDGQSPRRLLIACAQPGPDMFAATLDEGSRSWTISLSTRYGEEYMVKLDGYGRFGRASKLPGGLQRSSNAGYFEPGIFRDSKTRFLLVKAQVSQGSSPTQPQTRSQVMARKAVTWDLSTIPEYVVDKNARVARCVSHEGVLLCNLFTHRNPSELDEYVLPPEDPRLYCVEAQIRSFDPTADGGTSGMSSKMRGKLPERRTAPAGEGTTFRWRRDFEYRDQTAARQARALHPVVCNIQINARHAVALIRWNQTTPQSEQELFDREFHVLNASTGETLRLLEFPNLFWDFRHHDMHREYNLTRVAKLNNLYNPQPSVAMGASGNRTTRIHHDSFFLTPKNIISGSHDYCNWVWPLDRPTPAKGSYTEDHNDGGRIPEPFDVLDDYYWGVPASGAAATKKRWEPTNERAGWWVRTPNQVLCFWHGAALSHDQALFAVCRPGKMFVWNIEADDPNREVMGFTCLPADAANPRQRWLGRPKKGVESVLENWNLCEDVVPEQGLWLLYEGDNGAVFIDREEILEACGLSENGVQWGFQRDDFGWDDETVQPEDHAVASDSEEEEAEEIEANANPKKQRISIDLEKDGDVVMEGMFGGTE